jgi:hypothetical protein
LAACQSDNAPEYVLANVSANIRELIDFLETLPGPWANFVLKRGRSGKCYAEVDNWKPADKLADVARGEPPRGAHWDEPPQRAAAAADDVIPF